MLPETAIELVNGICYKPGWTLTAKDYSNRFEAHICVRVDYSAPETGRDNWPDYTQIINTYASFPIAVGDCDAEALYRRILEALIGIEVHEAREIFRVQPAGWSPFHPHTIDGMRRWGDRAADLTFGLV